jgi:hypothetical protein
VKIKYTQYTSFTYLSFSSQQYSLFATVLAAATSNSTVSEETGIKPVLYESLHSYIVLASSQQRWVKFRLSDPPIPTPIFRLYRPIFSRSLYCFKMMGLEATQSLQCTKVKGFKAPQSLHRCKIIVWKEKIKKSLIF